MSSILYYSNFCDHSKKILQILAKSNTQGLHYVCIDRREKGQNGKTFIILENGQKIVLPENITRVPALLLLNQGYQVLFGEAILEHLKPKQEMAVKQATFNNMEPMAFAFEGGGAFGSTVVSDQYSFIDQDSQQ
jgi:glutaredoxin-related protein